jgi:diaminopropionate ammonia-lyase
MKDISIKAVFPKKRPPRYPEDLKENRVKQVRAFHESVDGYAATPLWRLPNLAGRLGLKNFYVKDESYRFGLNAFKSLGATWALARILGERLGQPVSLLNFSFFKQPAIREKIQNLVFVTATDGNHGRGLAWAAGQLGCKSVIFMPVGTVKSRVANIQKEGARVHVTDKNYDDTVRLAAGVAKENGWIIVQDTAWEGYEKIPAWIVQGYATMAAESLEQIIATGAEPPTHLFVQAGVGSMAAAVLGVYANRLKVSCPCVFIVESDQADCMYQSGLADDGRPRAVGGELNTIMAGLACGEANPFAWEILRDFSEGFISCSDGVAVRGMQILANPGPGDRHIVSGESGAVGPGLVHCLMTDPKYSDLKEKMNLTHASSVLCFSTEGDTDPENYRKIIHGPKTWTHGPSNP